MRRTHEIKNKRIVGSYGWGSITTDWFMVLLVVFACWYHHYDIWTGLWQCLLILEVLIPQTRRSCKLGGGWSQFVLDPKPFATDMDVIFIYQCFCTPLTSFWQRTTCHLFGPQKPVDIWQNFVCLFWFSPPLSLHYLSSLALCYVWYQHGYNICLLMFLHTPCIVLSKHYL